MAYEIGGRADKKGNRFEYNWVISKVLEVIEEKIDYIILEAIGEDERGVDLWIGYSDGSNEGQQCKGRNGSQECWDFGTVNAKGIFNNWKNQLERKLTNNVALVSPLSFTILEDLTSRARNTNINPRDFYTYQIESSGKMTNIFFKQFCKVMDLDFKDDKELAKAINYLSRIFYRQSTDSELKFNIISKINLIFIGEADQIYAQLLDYILTEDIWGKRIDIVTLERFLKTRGIEFRNLARDTRILPKIRELNKEYQNAFICLHGGLIERVEATKCQQEILNGKSLIIHGKAGTGKSGCTENIINFCEDNEIMYLAIKLDKRIPYSTSEIWGNSMGLPASIAHCVHCVSKNKRAVIILDQLDALRWTQAHSGDALNVCFQVINEIENINRERKQKISIVMVCRTYDLENDHNIHNLFKNDNAKNIEWIRIQIGDLAEITIKSIVGNEYNILPKRLRGLLKIPSNLYIWEQLDCEGNYMEINTTQQLVSEWWRQLENKVAQLELSSKELNTIKIRIIEFCEKRGRIYAPTSIIQVSKEYLDFLCSNGFILVLNNKISFVHQSILDCFLSEYMLNKFYNEESVEDIIGNIDKQNPGRRYQVQLFMQQLLEISDEDFLDAGIKMLESSNIRYNVKYVFFEILSQIDFPSKKICRFICTYVSDEKWGIHILKSIIWGRKGYVELLRSKGILDSWMQDSSRRIQVINLMVSISPNYQRKDIEFIEKYAFQNQSEDREWSRCLYRDINEGIDELFDLRMKFYRKYPDFINQYIDVKAMMEQCEIRTIRLLAFMLEFKLNNKGKMLYRYEEELVYEDTEIIVNQYKKVIDILLPYIPKVEEGVIYSKWSGKYSYRMGIERVCIQLIKKANRIYVKKNPEDFFYTYKKYMRTGNALYNEIVLDAIYYLPNSYADNAIEYICTEFDCTLFEDTSGNKDKLLLAKKVVGKYAVLCSDEKYNQLEYQVMHYIAPCAKERLKRRIEYNKEKQGYTVYWNFWGDFQRDVLAVLPMDRMSNEAKRLLIVINRSLGKNRSIYHYYNGHSGSVWSPISGKELNLNNWKGILTNKKIGRRKLSGWEEVKGGFIESSLEEFSRSFNHAVSKDPEKMILLVLEIDVEISSVYIDSLFSGVAYSSHLDSLSVELIEKMFDKYLYDYKSHRAISICRIIEKKKKVSWSDNTIEMLKDIAINHENPYMNDPNVTTNDDKEMKTVEMLESNAINSARGTAAEAIANLLWEDRELLDEFRDTIEKLGDDENPAVRFASLYALWPVLNIDKKWAEEKIISLYRNDYRLAGFPESKDMFFSLYKDYKDDILKIIQQCYVSDDTRLIKIGSYAVAEMYILYNEFEDVMDHIQSMSKEQAEAILEMLIVYFGLLEYNEYAKEILQRFLDLTINIEFPWTRLFYDKKIDLERDKKFLMELISSSVSRRILHAFTYYLEEERKSLLEYNDIILNMCHYLLDVEIKKDETIWEIEEELSKLIIALYDETSNKEVDEEKVIANECLNIWDCMFEKQIGSARLLTSKMMEL